MATATGKFPIFPVGTPGTAWGETEKLEWLRRQTKKRDYFNDIVSPLLRISHGEVFHYGDLDYRKHGYAMYPIFGLRSKKWDESLPLVVVTGLTHGYETSGGLGAILFARDYMQEFEGKVNMLVMPGQSPFAYETINRWNPLAIDPNRQYNPENPGCDEAALTMKIIAEHVARSKSFLAHFDLHETTDTDNSEFTPAKIARDGLTNEPWEPIPDGFYLVASNHTNDTPFQQAMIEAVRTVTHIAPADEHGCIIGEKITSEGIITIEGKKWGICGAHTSARFATTTEVYPDSAKTSPEECNKAQAVCIQAGIRFALTQQ
eukprot:PhM_4_TR2775/c1_g2_i1/m.33259